MRTKNALYFENIDWTVNKVGEEVRTGLELLNSIDSKIITFFGSHKMKPGNTYYEDAKTFARKLGEKGDAIMTGGGPGLMEAANAGAKEAGAESIGIQASLLTEEQVADENFTQKLPIHFLFVRRFLLAIKSDALVFYPGGYGTLNELFEYATLIQTEMVDEVPIICVNKDYYQGLFDWLKNNPLKEGYLKHYMTDLKLIRYVEDHMEALEILDKELK
ncbi:TIGR00730 family Rossman fold protein [Patescibacteria group bacterium]|nr:TIGR00730 family Rossman fold protein [Patescibacteria group bacterium]